MARCVLCVCVSCVFWLLDPGPEHACGGLRERTSTGKICRLYVRHPTDVPRTNQKNNNTKYVLLLTVKCTRKSLGTLYITGSLEQECVI